MSCITLPLQDRLDPRPIPRPTPHRGAVLRRSMGMITTGWIFGAVWFAATQGAPLTLFARALHATPFQFGILSALPFVASLVSMPASVLIEATGKRRRIFLWGLYVQRFLWFPLAIAPLWMLMRFGQAAAAEAMGLFLVLTFIMHCGQAVGGPAWVSWMADIVPPRIRGKYFSRRKQWGMLTAIPAAAFAGYFLDHQKHAGLDAGIIGWCAIIFLCAAVFGLADITMFQFVDDAPKPRKDVRKLFHAFRRPMHDGRFLAFSAFVGTMQFAVNLLGQFATLYLLDVVKVDNLATQLILLVAPMMGQLLVLPVWGAAADRVGKKPLLLIASLGLLPIGLGWCLLTSGNPWLGYFLSAAGAALWAGVEVANSNFVMEMSARGDEQGGTSYVAVNSVIVNIAGCLGGLAAGAVAEMMKNWHWQPIIGWKTVSFYDVLFVLSTGLRLLAIVAFLPFIREAGARPFGEAVRFFTGGLVGSVVHLLGQPIRAIQALRPLEVEPTRAPSSEVPVRQAT